MKKNVPCIISSLIVLLSIKAYSLCGERAVIRDNYHAAAIELVKENNALYRMNVGTYACTTKELPSATSSPKMMQALWIRQQD